MDEERDKKIQLGLRVFFVAFLFLIVIRGYENMTSHSSPYSKTRSAANDQVAKAASYQIEGLGYQLPAWGVLDGYRKAGDFEVVWYLEPAHSHVLFLFVSPLEKNLKLSTMLEQLEALDREKFSEDTKRLAWPTLLPEGLEPAEIRLADGTLWNAERAKINLGTRVLDGLVVEFEKYDKRVLLLSFAGQFDPSIPVSFIDAFEKNGLEPISGSEQVLSGDRGGYPRTA